MANTLKFGNGQWATQEGLALAYNDENDNYKPLPFDFTRASTATRINKQGLIETVESGLPRIDYLNNTNGALLLEPQRTNAITNSDSFGSTGWSFVTTGSAIAPIVTDNYAISPDGTQNAQRIQFNLGGGNPSRSVIRQNIATQTDWFLSVYMKSTNGQEQKILWHTTSDSNETTVTGEWQRFTFSRNGISNSWAGLGLNAGVSSVDTADILVYGFQAEQGSYPTSYIKTQGSAVTRLADSCSQTPPSGIIGQTEGTVYTEINISNTTNKTILALDTGSASNFIILDTSSGLSPQIKVRQSSGSFPSIITGTTMNYGVNKIAFCYKSGDYAMYVNGVLSGTSTSTTFPSGIISKISIGANASYGYLSDTVTDFKLYNTRLSNSELAALTS